MSRTDPTRYLVTGARGMLGTELVAALAGRDVTAVGRDQLDLTAPDLADHLRRWAGTGDGRPLVVLNVMSRACSTVNGCVCLS